jgi:hypothetical protein
MQVSFALFRIISQRSELLTKRHNFTNFHLLQTVVSFVMGFLPQPITKFLRDGLSDRLESTSPWKLAIEIAATRTKPAEAG